MTVFTEGRHAAEFILSEANGQRSRENGEVAAGETLAAGEIVELSGGKLVAASGDLETDGSLTTPAAGILLAPVDASTEGTNDDTPAAYIARAAEVNGNLLKFPPETTGGNERALYIASLAELGIVVR